ncbi:MAG: NAD(+) synthase [Anaerolineae bacterium]|nr:MAG: NAD(+) synthase [Anaerolineae bacterium]
MLKGSICSNITPSSNGNFVICLPVDAEYARLVADTFDIKTVTADLGPVYDAFVAALPEGSDLARANLKPRLRMATLFYIANARGYLVAGTGNKSELMAGYFTKYGDGGADILPLGDLYKGQVWKLAREIGVPQPIIRRPPTAGLWPGQTDEGELGITYAALDAILAALATGQEPKADAGDVDRVRRMVAASAHKRALPPICEIGR